jgi:hypothetical protein
MGLFAEIAHKELLQQIVSVDAADEAAGVIVVRDISGILGKNITDKLVDRVIALLLERIIHGRQYFLHLNLAVDGCKFSCGVFHVYPPLDGIPEECQKIILSILYQRKMPCKGLQYYHCVTNSAD